MALNPLPSLMGGESGFSIVKVGGAVVEDPAQLAAFMDEFVKVEGPKVLVHGGGRTATQLAKQLGIESQMVGGRRVTDAETLRIVTMVYGGLVNKNIVAQLQARGVNALGLTGADLNIIRAHRRPITAEGVDFGFVGDVDSADGTRLLQLLREGITPVIAPLTHDGQGHLLNTNADTMAQTVATAIAQALDKPREEEELIPPMKKAESVSLTFCFELPGVLRDPNDPTTLIPHLTEPLFHTLVADGIIAGGMIPKLENAFAALRAGVASVRITNIHNVQGGTLVMNN